MRRPALNLFTDEGLPGGGVGEGRERGWGRGGLSRWEQGSMGSAAGTCSFSNNLAFQGSRPRVALACNAGLWQQQQQRSSGCKAAGMVLRQQGTSSPAAAHTALPSHGAPPPAGGRPRTSLADSCARP